MDESNILLYEDLQKLVYSKRLNQFKMAVFDMDGTLLDASHQMTERTITAVMNTERAGLTVLLATGRMGSAVENHLDKLGTSELVVSHNGALVKESKSGRVHYHKTIPRAVTTKLLELLNEQDTIVHFNFDDNVYLSQVNRYSEEYARDLEIVLHYVPSLNILEGEPTTIVIIGTKNKLVPLIKDLSDEFDEHFSHVMTPWFGDVWRLQLRPFNTSKGKTVLRVARQFEIIPEEIISFGDNLNDIEMLESTGLSIAMGNAVTEVKLVADFITLSNSEDGVAHVLEAFLKNI